MPQDCLKHIHTSPLLQIEAGSSAKNASVVGIDLAAAGRHDSDDTSATPGGGYLRLAAVRSRALFRSQVLDVPRSPDSRAATSRG